MNSGPQLTISYTCGQDIQRRGSLTCPHSVIYSTKGRRILCSKTITTTSGNAQVLFNLSIQSTTTQISVVFTPNTRHYKLSTPKTHPLQTSVPVVCTSSSPVCPQNPPLSYTLFLHYKGLLFTDNSFSPKKHQSFLLRTFFPQTSTYTSFAFFTYTIYDTYRKHTRTAYIYIVVCILQSLVLK